MKKKNINRSVCVIVCDESPIPNSVNKLRGIARMLMLRRMRTSSRYPVPNFCPIKTSYVQEDCDVIMQFLLLATILYNTAKQ